MELVAPERIGYSFFKTAADTRAKVRMKGREERSTVVQEGCLRYSGRHSSQSSFIGSIEICARPLVRSGEVHVKKTFGGKDLWLFLIMLLKFEAG